MTHGNDLEPKEVIERLGGNAKAAELCEVTPGAVSQWIRNGIPKAQLRFIRLARPDVFVAPLCAERVNAVVSVEVDHG